ncbi:MAG: FAD-dependent oxidoreductase, partial [Alphaproteobacteria bacterium]|nr:FAD-dependent oxidoreductase [Alphaproteobacteria bacterium]
DPELGWLTEAMPGSIHCRPDGGDHGNWIKLGWAFNDTPSQECLEPVLNDNFPEIVLRGAARLNPSLKSYYGHLPRNMTHYGGFYTLTAENWPLIGPMGVDGAFVVGAMSGFGTMAACAAGELCTKWLLGADLPDYADVLSLGRYDDHSLMAELFAQKSRGLL